MEASSTAGPSGPPTVKHMVVGAGTIGRQTFDMAHELIDGGKRPTEAFAIVAERTGRSAATVATAYYRVARTIPGGAGVKQRSRRGARAQVASQARARRPGSTIGDLLRELVDTAAALRRHVERLEQENAEYRAIVAQLDRLQRPR
jgi:hypothetical protein